MQFGKMGRQAIIGFTVSLLSVGNASANWGDDDEDNVELDNVVVHASAISVLYYMPNLSWLLDSIFLGVGNAPSDEIGVTVEVKGEHEFNHSVTDCGSSMGVRANFAFKKLLYITVYDINRRITVTYPSGGNQRWIVTGASSTGGFLKAETGCA